MTSTFNFSETSAFSPVPVDLYDFMLQPQQPQPLDLFPPMCEYDNRQLNVVEQWLSNIHQPAYEPPAPVNFLSYPYFHEYLGEPGFIRKRNERERMRVRSVNEGYARLRDHLPLEPTEKRLSKVETLRGAIKYIKLLEKVLQENDKSQNKKNNDNGSLNNYVNVANELVKQNIDSKEVKHNDRAKIHDDLASLNSCKSNESSPNSIIDVENN